MRKPYIIGLMWKATLPLIRSKASNRVRRAIFLSSLLATIRNISDPNQELINKLNSVFHVAKDPLSMSVPMMVHGFIWTDITDSSVVCDVNGCPVRVEDIDNRTFLAEDLIKVARYFIDRMPVWLRYGSDDEMSLDVQKLVTQMPNLRAA